MRLGAGSLAAVGTTVAAAAVTAALVSGGSAMGGGPARFSCNRGGIVPMLTGERVRILRKRAEPGFRVVCARGRRLGTAPILSEGQVAGGPRSQVSGPFVWFHLAACSRGGRYGECDGLGVAIRDVRVPLERELVFENHTVDLVFRADGARASVGRLQEDGQVAYSDPGPGPWRVLVEDRAGKQVLEADSHAIDPRSLALDGSRVFWVSGGSAKTALLAPGHTGRLPILPLEAVPSGPASRGCGPRGAVTVVMTASVRVFRRGGGDRRWRVCRRGAPGSVVIGAPRARAGSEGVFDLQLAGPFLSYAVAAGCGPSGCGERRGYLVDTRRPPARAKRLLAGVADVAVRSDGARARIARDGDGWVVVKRDGDGVAVLDRSPAIDPGSLFLDGDRLFWMRGGEPQTGLLRALYPPETTRAPLVSGAPRVGHTLAAGTGGWSVAPPVSFTYRWERCDPAPLPGGAPRPCPQIPGAVGQSYTLTAADVGYHIRAAVTATNMVGATTAISRRADPRELVTAAAGERVARVPASLGCEIESGAAENESRCSSETLIVGLAGDVTRRALLMFPVAEQLPAGAKVLAVTLGLSAPAAAGGVGVVQDSYARISTRSLARPWNTAVSWRLTDGIVAWTEPGGDFSSIPTTDRLAQPDDGLVTRPLATFGKPADRVQGWLDRTQENNGLSVHGVGDAPFTAFASPTAPDPATRPYLDVSYVPPPAP